MRTFFFYLLNPLLLKKGGFILPFKVYTKCKIKINASANLKLDSRLNIGSRDLPSTSPNTSSILLLDKAQAKFGSSVFIGGGVLIFVKVGAEFEMGCNSYITSDTHIECVNNIKIGNNCAISWGVTLIDDDHHEIKYEGQVKSVGKESIVIADNVWIGCNAVILKGTEIGAGSVVAAGSIVKGIFPENVLIAGNPAHIVKKNVSWK